jgi:glycosyltransferase involved in cell wall biosynthesis
MPGPALVVDAVPAAANGMHQTALQMSDPSYSNAVEGSTLTPEGTRGRAAWALELTVVMPCLNEAETLASCVDSAREAMHAHGIAGEVLVADNGSTDGSQEIAVNHGAHVVPVAQRGYGSAIMGGVAAGRGEYVIMGDADDSYDFAEIPRILAKLREGYDLVQGCRLEAGGGRVMPGAMPALHRWWGNPMFSWMAREWFKAPIHDIHCGLRGFRRDSWQRLDQRCTGMEFASEMVIKAALHGLRIAEVPIVLRPDGRKSRAPHLRTFRDGWRHLRFYLMFSPRWLFLLPGGVLILLGLAGYGIAMPAVQFGRVRFDVHTLLFSSLAIITGYQALTFAVFTKVFAIGEGLLPVDSRMLTLFRHVTLERGLVVGAVGLLAGAVLLGGAILQWKAVNFGALDYSHTMRWAIPGVTLSVLGVQTVFSSFFLSILGMSRQ